ncbi:MAG: hypothetical protein OIF54_16475 [Cohaesibacter sp.]|nr:hypothetical protein [Cohaesibacter sp.]
MSSSEQKLVSVPSGASDLYVVVGDPVVQVRSVALYNRIFADLGVDAICVPMHFGSHSAEDVFSMLRHIRNLRGIVATIPHKGGLLAASDEASSRARQIGVANIARLEDGRLYCDAVDGLGYLNGLAGVDYDVRGKRVQLIGAGGAGQSLAFALAEAGIRSLSLYDCNQQRMSDLVLRLQKAYPQQMFSAGWCKPEALDLITNASPVGMIKDGTGEDVSPLDNAYFNGGNKPFVTDMVMQPSMTRLLIEAKAAGCEVQTGLEALRGQARATLEHFGIRLPASYVIELDSDEGKQV